MILLWSARKSYMVQTVVSLESYTCKTQTMVSLQSLMNQISIDFIYFYNMGFLWFQDSHSMVHLWFHAIHGLGHWWLQDDHSLDHHIWFPSWSWQDHIRNFVWLIWRHTLVRLWSAWLVNLGMYILNLTGGGDLVHSRYFLTLSPKFVICVEIPLFCLNFTFGSNYKITKSTVTQSRIIR